MDNVVISPDFSGIMVGFKRELTTKQPKQPGETASEKKARESLGARIAYAKVLITYFASIGRQMIHVKAIDENQQTLDVFSVAIGKPFGRETHNLISASEVIQSAEAIVALKTNGFKKVAIRGTDFAEAYNVE